MQSKNADAWKCAVCGYIFVFRDNNLVGAILLGDTAMTARATSAIETRRDFSALLRQRPAATDVLAHLAEA